ncbi:AfsR/SARP family transcriptional regulator [Saccharothrix variisporea]|uniref:DNA-binding SARP family transcriptional activator n=1 Tax=Saccharothrix variisporea TaxID=543527 RepID=A0A495XEK4_9PSEU|nr:tetratricopeptide repeat protein [Saccharothrix variisporea]RKT72690.1 DNA-binding SARP family transcriptional activator [Saccharothrix variisporea]
MAEFRLFGEVSFSVGGRRVDVGPPRRQCVLAVLLVEVNRLVPVDVLAERVWFDQAPRKPHDVLYSYVSRLRRVLAADPDTALVRRSGGYVLETDPLSVDVHRFRHLVAESAFDEALELWRGTPLERLDTPWAESVRAALEVERLAAEVERTEQRLARNLPTPDLPALAAAHPLDERIARLHMRALYRAGRQADALDHFERVRRRLADELGADPSPPLRRAHEEILRGTAEPARPSGRNDLPADAADFTGREHETKALLAAVEDEKRTVVAVDGMAGVGKTTFAVHVAHLLADRYPDACLFLDLHAHTAGRSPTSTATALEVLLRALGVPKQDVPDGVDERSALLRATLAGHRVLLVLDNAESAAQVRPLLPGAAGSLAVVTSRRRLVDLPAWTLSLEVLPFPDALALFAGVVGDGRSERQPDAAAEVVRLCENLPLAIRLAAARLRSRPQWTVEHLAGRLGDGRRRLRELAVGEMGVASAFELSHAALPADRRRLFRLLGLHPGADVDVEAAAALAGLDVEAVEPLLEDLVDVHLLQEPVPGRYRFHDLLRDHARKTALDTEPDPREPVHRLVEHYLAGAAAADRALAPKGGQQMALSDRHFASRDDALRWLTAEHANLVAVTGWCGEHAPGPCWRLATALFRYLHIRGYNADLRHVHEVALVAADRDGDPDGRAVVRAHLGLALYRQGDFAAAHAVLREAVDLDRPNCRNQALAALGNAAKKLGRFDEALACFHRDLDLCRAAGNRHGEAVALGNLGAFHIDIARYEEGVAYLVGTLAAMREAGDRVGETVTLGNLGQVYLETGRAEEALDQLGRALALCQELGDRHGEARTLTSLGEAHGRLGRSDEALKHHHKALELIGEIGSHSLRTAAFNGLGTTLRHCGRPAEALDSHREALEVARRIGEPLQEAKALDGIAACLAEAGDHAAAETSWHAALTIFTALHHQPQVDRIEAHLAGLPSRAR